MAQSEIPITVWQKIILLADADWTIQNTGGQGVFLKFQAAEPATTDIGFLLERGDVTTFEKWGYQDVWARSTERDTKAVVIKGVADNSTTKIIDENKTLLELDPLVNSIPTTDTFHHLGHEGKVFIHTDRHSAIADGANLDILIRIPAGNADRQVHMRFNYIGKANTGTLDIDIELYKDVTVSADGVTELIASTNDAVVKTTGVLMFSGPTVTDIGTFKSGTLMVGEKKSASSKEQSVPEYILAPNGVSARDYIIRAKNNSGGTADIVTALFFYDSEAV